MEINETDDINVEYTETNFTEETNELELMFHNDLDSFQEDALEYVAGYIIRKLRLTNSKCVNNEGYTWIDQLSKGGLKKPSRIFLKNLSELEIIFDKINGDSIVQTKNVCKMMLEKCTQNSLPENVKTFFFKIRI